MPYLKLTSPDLPVETKRAIAGELIDAVAGREDPGDLGGQDQW